MEEASSLVSPPMEGGLDWFQRAHVERAPLDSSPYKEGAAKPSFTARIERPPLYRGGSASKKDGWLPPRPLLGPYEKE